MYRAVKLVAGVMLSALGISSVAHADAFVLNYEAPGVQNTTASFSTVGVETFDNRTNGQGFTTDFGTGGKIDATYSPLNISSANLYGGAGGVGNYAVAYGGAGYSLKFNADPSVFPKGVNYFGYWLSALDPGNQVEFYNQGNLVGSLSPAQVLARIGNDPAYFGNPNANFKGQNGGQAYAFINFYDTNGSFDEVRFLEDPAVGGYESDNHTIGFYTQMGGVPEPMTWAMMIVGFGFVGAAMRGRRGVPSVA